MRRRTVQLYLSYFSLCRAIKLAKRLDKTIVKSIAFPPENLGRISSLSSTITSLTKDLFMRYCPSVLTTPLCQGIRWDPTWKAIPTRSVRPKGKADTVILSNFPYELFWMFFRGFGLSPMPWTGFPTLTAFVRYPFDDRNDQISSMSNMDSMNLAAYFKEGNSLLSRRLPRTDSLLH